MLRAESKLGGHTVSSTLNVAPEQLVTLAKRWRTTGAEVADNAAARSVASCVRAMPGSHVAWAGTAVADRLEADLHAVRERIEQLARSAEDTSADYRAADGTVADGLARLQGR